MYSSSVSFTWYLVRIRSSLKRGNPGEHVTICDHGLGLRDMSQCENIIIHHTHKCASTHRRGCHEGLSLKRGC